MVRLFCKKIFFKAKIKKGFVLVFNQSQNSTPSKQSKVLSTVSTCMYTCILMSVTVEQWQRTAVGCSLKDAPDIPPQWTRRTLPIPIHT